MGEDRDRTAIFRVVVIRILHEQTSAHMVACSTTWRTGRTEVDGTRMAVHRRMIAWQMIWLETLMWGHL